METASSDPQPGPTEGQVSRFGAVRDRRQLYALDRRTDTVVYLPDGEADQFRADCLTDHLVCPLPNCGEPEYTTVGGTVRRHHFRHRSRGLVPHDLRTWSHLIATLLLESELGARHPNATITRDPDADDRLGENDLTVSFPDGRRFAIAVQYRRITPEQLQDRHQASLDAGLIPVWIFGHLPPLFRRPRHEQGEDLVALGTLLLGLPWDQCLFFIDPDQQEIATVLRETSRRDLPRGTLQISGEPITELAFEEQLLLTPSARRERTAAAERIVHEQREQEREEERIRQLAFLRRLRKPPPLPVQQGQQQPLRPPPTTPPQELQSEQPLILSAAEQTERDMRAQAQEHAQQGWEEHGRTAFLRAAGLDQLPLVIDQQQELSDRKIFWLTPAQWRARLFWRHICGRRGETFTLAQAAQVFLQERPGAARWEVREAIADYLPLLRRDGWVHFEGRGDEPHMPITVLADLDAPPSPRLAELARGSSFVVRLAKREGELICISWEGELLAQLRPLRPGERNDDIGSQGVGRASDN